ncbi:hypothetical protein Tco_0931787 [Tanacetum coccineum]
MVRRGGSFNHCVLVSKAMVTGGGFCGVGGGLCGGDGEWHGGGGLFTDLLLLLFKSPATCRRRKCQSFVI